MFFKEGNSVLYMGKEKAIPNRLPYYMDIYTAAYIKKSGETGPSEAVVHAALSEEILELTGREISAESIRKWKTFETDLTHGKMADLAAVFGCEPYELIIDKEEILNKELAYLNEQRRFFNAFKTAPPNIQNSICLQLGLDPGNQKISDAPSLPNSGKPHEKHVKKKKA